MRLAPKSAQAANAMGLAELGAADIPAAISSFRKAVEWAPRGSYHMNLARAYLMDRKADEALRVLDEALRSAPRQPQTLALAATILVTKIVVERQKAK